MSVRSEIGRSLSFFKTFQDKIVVTLKSKKHKPFIAKVKAFDHEEEDARVIFSRCEETVFPDEDEQAPQEEYMTYFKNVKSVDSIEEDK